jgi:uncharacterized protein (DUF983 family)
LICLIIYFSAHAIQFPLWLQVAKKFPSLLSLSLHMMHKIIGDFYTPLKKFEEGLLEGF